MSDLMTANEKFEKTREIVARVLELPMASVTMESSMDNLPRWDSLRFLTIVCEVEAAFKIKFNRSEIKNLRSIKSLVESVATLKG